MRNRSMMFMLMAWLTLFMTKGYVTPVLYAAPKADVKVESQAQAVSLNKASAEELQSLRGIGPSLAERIVKYRETHGRFEKMEDLTNVNGIGQAKFQKLKEHLTL